MLVLTKELADLIVPDAIHVDERTSDVESINDTIHSSKGFTIFKTSLLPPLVAGSMSYKMRACLNINFPY